MSAIGDELVTLEQFKRAVSGGGGKKYKITKNLYSQAQQPPQLNGTGAASHRHIIGGEGTD